MKHAVVILLSVLFVAYPSSSLADQNPVPSTDWAAVRAIAPGERIAIYLKDGKTLKGELVSVSDSAVNLNRKKKTTSIEQSQILKVYRLVKRTQAESAGRSALIGAGTGAAIGAGFGIWLGALEGDSTAPIAFGLGAIGAGIGSGIGIVTGLIKKGERRVIVYQSR